MDLSSTIFDMLRLIFLFLTTFSFIFGDAQILPQALIDSFHLQELSEQDLLAHIQKEWRQQGKERWDFDRRFEDQKETLAPIFEEMGYLQERVPSKTSYKYALIHGATIKRVKSRLASLKKAMDQGVRFERVVFLSGMRFLEPFEREGLPSSVQTEAEMAQWVADQQDWLVGRIPFEVINAPPPPHQTRPSTIDTLKTWLATNPEPGPCLAFSNQPYIPYQDAIAKNVVPLAFEWETAGDAADENWSVAIVLDTIARTTSLHYFSPQKHREKRK